MTLTRRSVLPIASLATAATIVAAAVVVGGSTSASAVSVTPYSVTYVGFDANSLDPGLQGLYVGGGGMGGVFTHQTSNATAEIGLNLPVGAQVTSVAVSYSWCAGGSAPTASFAVVTPSTAKAAQITAFAGVRSCTVTTATKTGAPMTTVLAGRRYVLDFTFNYLAPYPGGKPETVFYGTTVKYTCDAPCVQ